MSSGARAGKSMPSGAAKEMDSPAPPMCWDLIQGIGCIRPFAFAARPSGPARPTGFPSMARRLHLYYKCIPGLGICFGIRRHRPTSAAHYTATRLHAYGATRRRPTERREGRPWAPSGHAPIFEREVPSGPPESRLHLQAFIRNRAARLKIPGLNREASPAFPLTLCVNIKRRARASAFAETRAKICATEMTR